MDAYYHSQNRQWRQSKNRIIAAMPITICVIPAISGHGCLIDGIRGGGNATDKNDQKLCNIPRWQTDNMQTVKPDCAQSSGLDGPQRTRKRLTNGENNEQFYTIYTPGIDNQGRMREIGRVVLYVPRYPDYMGQRHRPELQDSTLTAKQKDET